MWLRTCSRDNLTAKASHSPLTDTRHSQCQLNTNFVFVDKKNKNKKKKLVTAAGFEHVEEHMHEVEEGWGAWTFKLYDFALRWRVTHIELDFIPL